MGNRLQSGLGTADALIAVILGSWILFIYSAAIGFAAGRWGLSPQLTLEAIFGRWGAPSGHRARISVTGWFAFHVVLTADVLLNALHFSRRPCDWVMQLIGVAFAAPVICPAQPWFQYDRRRISRDDPVRRHRHGAHPDAQMAVLAGRLDGRNTAFGTGVCVAFGIFVVSGTMTGDIVRYCRTGTEAVLATAIGFLLSNLPFMILGVLIGAAHADVVDILLERGWLSTLALGLVFLSHWATCDACLANAGITLKSAFPRCRWQLVTSVAVVVGIVMAAGNLVNDAFWWSLFVAAVIPPIGGIIVADYYVVRTHYGFSRGRNFRANIPALFALCVSIAVSLWLWKNYPDIITPLVGAPLAGVFYSMLVIVAPTSPGASPEAGSLGAEAVD